MTLLGGPKMFVVTHRYHATHSCMDSTIYKRYTSKVVNSCWPGRSRFSVWGRRNEDQIRFYYRPSHDLSTGTCTTSTWGCHVVPVLEGRRQHLGCPGWAHSEKMGLNLQHLVCHFRFFPGARLTCRLSGVFGANSFILPEFCRRSAMKFHGTAAAGLWRSGSTAAESQQQTLWRF